MKNYLISTFLLLLQFLMIVKSITDEYIDPFTIICYYIFILFSAYIFIKIIAKKLIVSVITIVYCVFLFTLLFSPREARYQSLINQSDKGFWDLTNKNVIVINILAQLIHKKDYYKFSIYNKDIIKDFLISLNTCKEIHETGIHMWDYYAITFMEDNGNQYSIVLKKNCAISNNADSVFCNVVFLKLNPNFHVFDITPDYGGVVFYKCNEVVPLLKKHIETLINKYPKKYKQIIN